MIERVLVSVPTPFATDGIAERPFVDTVECLIAQGVDGIAPCSITGEGPTLSVGERTRLVSIAVETAAGRAKVVPATGTNATASTIALTRQAKKAGADAVLIVVPYYSRPSQEGIWRHFDAVARSVDVPIVIHNAATRTGVHLVAPTVARLAQIPSVVGIVDDDDQRCWEMADSAGDGAFQQLCGCDEQMVTASLAGRRGCLSSLANLAPRLCVELQRACAAGDYRVALTMQTALVRFRTHLADIDETVAIKSLLEQSRPGFGRAVRLPLVGLPKGAADRMRAAFDTLMAEDRRLSEAQDLTAGFPLRARLDSPHACGNLKGRTACR